MLLRFRALLLLLPNAFSSPLDTTSNSKRDWTPADSNLTCFFLTTHLNWTGERQNICQVAGECATQLPDGLFRNVSSAGPSEGQTCFLYSGPNCSGNTSAPIVYPGYPALSHIGFDKKAESWRCWKMCGNTGSNQTTGVPTSWYTGSITTTLSTFPSSLVPESGAPIPRTSSSLTIFRFTEPEHGTITTTLSGSQPTGGAHSITTTLSSSGSKASSSSPAINTTLSETQATTRANSITTTLSFSDSTASSSNHSITTTISGSQGIESGPITSTLSGSQPTEILPNTTAPSSTSNSTTPTPSISTTLTAPPSSNGSSIQTSTAESNSSTATANTTAAGFTFAMSPITLTHTYADGSTTVVTTSVVEPVPIQT